MDLHVCFTCGPDLAVERQKVVQLTRALHLAEEVATEATSRLADKHEHHVHGNGRAGEMSAGAKIVLMAQPGGYSCVAQCTSGRFDAHARRKEARAAAERLRREQHSLEPAQQQRERELRLETRRRQEFVRITLKTDLFYLIKYHR